MQVKVNKPEPQPLPPNTYDLIGLSEEQARLICLLVGCTAIDAACALTEEPPAVGLTTIEKLHIQLSPLRSAIPRSTPNGRTLVLHRRS